MSFVHRPDLWRPGGVFLGQARPKPTPSRSIGWVNGLSSVLAARCGLAAAAAVLGWYGSVLCPSPVKPDPTNNTRLDSQKDSLDRCFVLFEVLYEELHKLCTFQNSSCLCCRQTRVCCATLEQTTQKLILRHQLLI